MQKTSSKLTRVKHPLFGEWLCVESNKDNKKSIVIFDNKQFGEKPRLVYTSNLKSIPDFLSKHDTDGE